MLKKLTFVLIALAFAASATAGTLTKDGLVLPGTGDNVTVGDRLGLVNDGSFEFGECDAGSAWTCYTSTTCAWILDPIAVWGYPAYDGVFVAWLGGFCGDANENSFCQSIFFDGMYLDWYWMGYVNNGCGYMYVTVDGNIVFDHVMDLSEHTYGSWNTASSFWGQIDVGAYCGTTAELCLGWLYCDIGTNDNMLVDYVTLDTSCGTATEETTFSNVKSLY